MSDTLVKEIEFLAPFITDERKQKVDEVLSQRTRKITVVLEDIYQSQNASAVLRTCDSYGIQDVHIIENRNEYRINPLVTIGCDKWLTINRYNEGPSRIKTCVDRLKKDGYKLVATTLNNYDCSLFDLPLDEKLAFVFGNEKEGISEEIEAASDIRMYIPMFGFSQSFNISVSAAITLSYVMKELREKDKSWMLPAGEINELKLEWYRKITDLENKIGRSLSASKRLL